METNTGGFFFELRDFCHKPYSKFAICANLPLPDHLQKFTQSLTVKESHLCGKFSRASFR